MSTALSRQQQLLWLAQRLAAATRLKLRLTLTSFWPHSAAIKLLLLKEVRAITGLGLKEAKELVEGAPKAVKEGVPQAEADELKEKLEATGATVELK